jgi:hypothetical protein
MTHGPDGTGRGQVGRWGWLQVDCADPVGLATFWAAVLGGEVALADASGDPPQYLGIRPMPAGGPELSFQRVPEPKTTKNRLHLDVAVDDVEEAAARVVALGASRVATTSSRSTASGSSSWPTRRATSSASCRSTDTTERG